MDTQPAEAKLTSTTDLADFNGESPSDFELLAEEEINEQFVFNGIVKFMVKGFESVVPENFARNVKRSKYAVPYNPNSDPQIV